jgi:hypothetical protein
VLFLTSVNFGTGAAPNSVLFRTAETSTGSLDIDTLLMVNRCNNEKMRRAEITNSRNAIPTICKGMYEIGLN